MRSFRCRDGGPRTPSRSTQRQSPRTYEMKDEIYRTRQPTADFVFDEGVTAVFPDMIRRSVPGYDTVVAVSALIAASYARPSTSCYDLGCSRGATTVALAGAVADPSCRIIGVDSSKPMIEEARKLVTDPRVALVQSDIRDADIDNASAVVMNYTLQFVPRGDRRPLLDRIRAGCTPGAVLIISEKVVDTPEFERLHLDFKRANGYSELEIAQKRTALEQVMQVDAVEDHIERLRGAGFGDARVWFRCLNWVSIMAVAAG